MPDHHHKKQFLNLPKYAGGNKAFREFIAEQLRYPDAALEDRIEGSVVVEYDILDNGSVSNPRVLKSLGYGCDEEALRVIGLLRFEKVKNRGVRVRLTSKTTINFHLPGANPLLTVAYTMEPEKPKDEPEKKSGEAVTYNYTIQL
jgi:protein TonB